MKFNPVIVLAIFSLIVAQEDVSAQTVNASPVGGWDSLKAHIKYPELLQRAAVEGCAIVTVRIDSTGAVIAPICIRATEATLEYVVQDALYSVKWHPALDNGKPVSSVVEIPVFFFITNKLVDNRIIIEREQPPIYQ